jgi:hypothetical protein
MSNGEAKDTQLVLINAADIRPKPVKWLWRLADGWSAAWEKGGSGYRLFSH